MATLTSINPATGKPVGDVDVTSAKDIEKAVVFAKAAQAGWKALGIRERIKRLRPLMEVFRSHGDELALMITREMGKPITESRVEIVTGCTYFEWFLDNAEVALQETVTKKDEREIHRVFYEPIGTAAVILPWNFPFDIFIWGVMTNLIAGNTVVVKHSEHCPHVGQLLETYIRTADLPVGVFSEVYGGGEAGKTLVEQPIDLIWFTGSSATGRRLYELGGKKMIKVLLEMGGSNPTIVFEDVSIPEIQELVMKKRLLNCGQSCSALKRLLVHASLLEPMTQAMKHMFESQVIGDPEQSATTLGPLVSVTQAKALALQVEDAVAKGATVVTGGGFVTGKSQAFYRPTLLTNITPDMRVWREEVFGPVLPIVPFQDEAEAVSLAEDSVYGLGAQIYSKDTDRALRVAAQLKVGNIEINGASRRIPCNPFGGCKASGMGREHGVYGFREVSELKQVSIPVGAVR
jgi:succinate-semialdehyde dehydrogenase / glutarate-semialdehyde dehydrogenase